MRRPDPGGREPGGATGLPVRLGPFCDMISTRVVYDITGTPLAELQLHNSQLAVVCSVFDHSWSTLAAYPGELCGYAPADLVVA